jgi:hypothetical protein
VSLATAVASATDVPQGHLPGESTPYLDVTRVGCSFAEILI